MRILDIGCGRAKEPGAVGLDWNPATDADVSALPVLPGSFDRILIRHIIDLIERRITFCRLHRWLGIAWLANRFPEIWEFHFSGLFKARDIRFRLRVKK